MISIKQQRAIYVFSDFVTLNLGWLLFNVARYFTINVPAGATYPLQSLLLSNTILIGQALFPLLIVAMYWLSGYYHNVFFKSRIDELGNTISVSALSTIIIYFVALINDDIPERLQNYEIMMLLFGLLFTPTYILRAIITLNVTRRIHRRELAFNTLIIGATRGAAELAKKIQGGERGNGFNVVGFIDTLNTGAERTDLGRPVYNLNDIGTVCEALDVRRLVMYPHRNGIRETGELINRLFSLDRSIYITPDLYNMIAMRPRMTNVVAEPLIDITRNATKPSTLNMKRLSDIVISAIVLILLIPVYVILAIIVKTGSPGNVFYKQERIGRHKRPFYIYKFRTMRTDAESNGPTLSTLDDPRITKTGHIFRKYRLDELPQFWNVLKGDMSIVGPRPERDFYIKQIVQRAPYYSLVHQVRPGITSWGMVKFGYASTVDDMIKRLKYDLIYIENISMSVDMKILFYTVHTVFTGKGI